jgi:hypothetical protein
MTLDEYFDGNEESRLIFECLREMIESMGPVEVRVQQSQIAFLRNKAFAYTSLPRKYQHGRGAPLIFFIALRRRDPSPRWKKVVQLPTNSFTHYMEMFSPNDVDDQLSCWLQEAWVQAT